MPFCYPECAGEPYRPSNGTEGEIFQEAFCYRCKKEPTCKIVGLTMCYDVEDPKYPKEWKFNAEGKPTCTELEMEE